jgi:hypothetical protein
MLDATRWHKDFADGQIHGKRGCDSPCFAKLLCALLAGSAMEDLLHGGKSKENVADSYQHWHIAENESDKIKACDTDESPVDASDPHDNR